MVRISRYLVEAARDVWVYVAKRNAPDWTGPIYLQLFVNAEGGIEDSVWLRSLTEDVVTDLDGVRIADYVIE